MNQRIDRVRERFTFPLSSDELVTKGQEAADLNKQVSEKEYTLSIYKKERKAEIDNLRSNINSTLKVIAAKAENREVECDKIYNYDRKVIEYVYHGELMKERAMDQLEAQTQFSNVVPPAVLRPQQTQPSAAV